MPDVLRPNKVVEGVHQGGVALLKSAPTAARAQLLDALQQLPNFYVPEREKAKILHEARINRDLGNAALRQGVALVVREENAAPFMEESRQFLTLSRETLAGMYATLPTSGLPEADRHYVEAEYGATLSLQGRERVVALMLDDEKAGDEAARLFAEAAKHTTRDAYYDTSNNFHAARLEAYCGHHKDMLRWALRGGMALARAYNANPTAFKAASATAGRLTRDLCKTNSGIRRAVLSGGV